MAEHTDRHVVPVPEGWTSRDFASHVLGQAPAWLRQLLRLRDILVSRLGFAGQPGPTGEVVLNVGGTAGPFTFTEVTDDVVRGGNADRHIGFESEFRVENQGGRSVGVLETWTSSSDRIGHVYLTVIWPAHRVLMGSILRHGMADVYVS